MKKDASSNSRAGIAPGPSPAPGPSRGIRVIFALLPWCLLAVFGSDIIALFKPKPDGEFHLRDFGSLPVLMNGRIQPFDSVARNTLLQIRSTGEVPLEEVPAWKFWHHAQKLRSTPWLLEVLFKPDVADTRPIFLIHHPDLLAELNLRDKGVEKSALRYYTFEQLKPVLDEISKQGAAARKVKAENRNTFQQQVVKLENALFHYQALKTAARPVIWDDFAVSLAEFEKSIPDGIKAVRAWQAGESYDKDALDRFWTPIKEMAALAEDGNAGQLYPLVVPPASPSEKRDDWMSMSQAILQSARDREIPQPVKCLATIASGYASDNPAGFNAGVSQYRQWLERDFQPELKKGREEFFFNNAKLFLHAILIYVSAFVIALLSWLTVGGARLLAESLRRAAFYLVILSWGVHTFGLVFRMYLEGRPPVTNLYSSAVFIGWGAVVLGMFLERIYRLGVGNVVGAFAGFVTLLIAHSLALGGDTMEMMRAVLDTNFWLATHVVVVTLGYASTFFAGFLAILYVFLGLCTPMLTMPVGRFDLGKVLAKMVYAIVCFATLFSFVGTVLGGLWADQSWGRFWGWDPKENGALIIVLWNALILHARWGGMVRDRGLVIMAIFGNVVTSFSWFGVNLLNIGLHSYGFTDSGFKCLVGFVASQGAIIALGGLLPLRLWRSFARVAA